MRAIIFDLDGTLADCRHRQYHVKHKDWNSFYAGIGEDGPIKELFALKECLYHAGYKIILCSGRPDEHREATISWLTEHEFGPFDELYMRATGDYRKDHIVKSQLLDGMITDGYEPFLVIDDRPTVVAMWRERGLMCLQANNDWDEPKSSVAPGLLTLMVGPSGSGKTTFLASAQARDEFGIFPAQIVSSDGLRQELCGDWRDQTKNDEVFEALHAIVKTRVSHGLRTVVDATNIRTKDRKAIAALTTGSVRYIIIDRPIAEKREMGGWRNTITGGFDLIGKHDQTFKSNLKDILSGDNLPNVTVCDLRK